MGLKKGQTNSGSFKKGIRNNPEGEWKKNELAPNWNGIKKGEVRNPKGNGPFKRGNTLGFKKGMCSGKDNPNWKGGSDASSARTLKKHKEFGFIPLNERFIGCEAHHIDKEFVIYIPKEMHKSIWHSVIKDINMDKINNLAIDYCYGD